MASLRLWKKVATPLPSGWKMACTTVAAPFSSTVENSDPIKAEKVGKMKIFRWMDKKKMMFSPSELELYVDLLGKVLHWFRVKEQNQTSGAKPHVLKFPKVDDPLWAKNSTPTTPAQKRNLFSKLKSSETCCAHLLREMEDQWFCITKADLNRWIKLLEKQGQTQKALQIDKFKEWKYLYFYHQLRGTFNPSSVSWDPSYNIPDVT
ncbi:hypothetical protein F2Q69_00063606 [Brassica cretica]|uniref:Uncharacterized protein n=1 Tax=Brassica cretica TaxID=69181 RepID=A0A8S9RAQ5_BRACR|nr:hypothetical protein F2Q69_00063606 [Brassica cretica]